MGTMFAMIFAFFTKLFSMMEKFASAGDHLATWADEAAGQFADVSRHERSENLKAMMAAANITELPKAAPSRGTKLTGPATKAIKP